MINNSKSHSALLAKRNGEHFERLIEITCAYYSKMGVALIQKTPEPMRVLKDLGRGQFKAVFTKKAQPDFTGTLKSGKSVVFEAKHTDGTNIPFSRINEEQERDLRIHDHLGAISFVLISFSMKHFYAVPFQEWMQLKESSDKKSVNQVDLVNYQVSTEKGFLNFMEVVYGLH